MINKTVKIMEHLTDHNPSIVFLSETWLKSNKNDVTACVKKYGYILLHNRRQGRQKELGGGVGLLLKTGISYKHLNYKQYSSFELTVVKIHVNGNKHLILVSIYRVLFVSVSIFLDEIVQLFEALVALKDSFILAGDVNIHMDEEGELNTGKFKDILNTFNVVQHVDFPTHIQGHTLDIIATFSDAPKISDIDSNLYDVSHHSLVTFNANVSLERRLEKQISYRNTKNIDLEKFNSEINFVVSSTTSFGENITQYNEKLLRVLDTHAPLKTRIVKIVPEAPWFDCEYETLRKKRRKAEKSYKRTHSEVDRVQYKSLCKQAVELAQSKKTKYYADKISSSKGKLLYSVVNQLLDQNQDAVLPDTSDNKELADGFMNFFIEKIKKIREKFYHDADFIPIENPCPNPAKLISFDLTDPDEVRQIVTSYGIKCSPEDPIPAALLKLNIDFFIPIWTELINLSLTEGSMECLKGALLIPLIKDLDDLIDKDNKKNYRPVSNLLFVGKLIERVVSKRLNKHLDDNNLNSNAQYGYRKGHSTETLLVKVVNDLLNNCDNQKPTILVLLDLSAAFDTVDQCKLLTILHDEIGVEGVALKWCESFLRGRSQKVKIGDTCSDESSLDYGVAQGSVLGPDFFKIYVRSLPRYVEPVWFNIFGFADDHQLLKTFLPWFQVSAFTEDIQQCFYMISKWMNHFFLCLNASKTKILIIAPPSIRNEIVMKGTFINDKCIRFVTSAKNLGVILDEELSFEKHITHVVKGCFCTIRSLTKIKAYLTYEQLRTIICACIFSRIDYCNSLYYGLNSPLINKLQSVQNTAARMLKRNDIGTPLDEFIRKCHWLKVKERIIFKICLLIHKCLYGIAPSSLKELLTYKTLTRQSKLVEHSFKGIFGGRRFARIGPKIWNLLPFHVRMERQTVEFKTCLKTYLFANSRHLIEKLHER